MYFKQRFFAVFTVVCCSLSHLPLYGKSLPVSAFSQLPVAENVTLSPSGNYIAYLNSVSIEKSGEAVTILTVFDLNNGKSERLLTSDNEDARIRWYEWVNDEQIIVSAMFADKRPSGYTYTKVLETRLIVLDVKNEEKAKVLIKPRRFRDEHISQLQDDVVSFLPDEPDHILLSIDVDTALLPSVYKVNTRTLERTRLERGKRKIRKWFADQQGNVRAGTSIDYKDGVTKILVREVGKKEFTTLFEYNAFTEPEVALLGFGNDPNVLYYKAYFHGYMALFKMTIDDQKSELVLSDEMRDVDGELIYSLKLSDAVGIAFSGAKHGTYYWEKSSQDFEDALSLALPDSMLSVLSFDKEENRYVVYSETDNKPGVYYIGDREKGVLQPLFSQYPDLMDKSLPEHELITYKARDGVSISGYLTLPPEDKKKNLPTIIFPHGGPLHRDYDGFDYWTAFFADQGYAVLRPNFRGSSGYGYDFSQERIKGWGLAMQDDITDGTKWLIEEGIADPEHICIVGASYGGYAAAMGLAKEPDMYRCGVSFAGVMDLKKLVWRARSFVNNKFIRNEIGDESEDLKQRSPYYNIDKIKAPLLLIHGEEDRVVDVTHSQAMYDAMRDANKDISFIELESGSHQLGIQRNRHEAFSAMQSFLETYLKH